MENLKAIRARLSLTQKQLGDVIGCTQGNVGFIERGTAPLMPERAVRLIDFAAANGLALTLDQIYDRAPLPPAPAEPETQIAS